MSTVNLVKYFFYAGMLPKDPKVLQQTIALTYQTARDRRLYPAAILIRSHFHDTTTIGGRHEKDPKGWHLTFCYKDATQVSNGTHTACHGYTPGKNVFELVERTHAGVKIDSTTKRSGHPVWPEESALEVAPEIGYGHIPHPSESQR